MGEQVFRKSSLDRVNSPEQLNEYIRVANPSVWLVLAAVVVLLAGVCVWGIFGRIETAVTIPVVVKGSEATGYITADEIGGISKGMDVSIGDAKGTVAWVSDVPGRMGDDTDPYVLFLGGFSQGDFCYLAKIAAGSLTDGVYEAKIITDSVSPISFVIQ